MPFDPAGGAPTESVPPPGSTKYTRPPGLFLGRGQLGPYLRLTPRVAPQIPVGGPVRANLVSMAKLPHRGLFHPDPSALGEIRCQLGLGPVGPLQPAPGRSPFDPLDNCGGQRCRDPPRRAGRPLDLQSLQPLLAIALQPQPQRRAMHASVLRNPVSRTTPCRHQHRLTAVAHPPIRGCFKRLFEHVFLVWC
jgi:hypothetical protein